ncbi:hypothetical protein ES708_32677 [subsurface metagenome]
MAPFAISKFVTNEIAALPLRISICSPAFPDSGPGSQASNFERFTSVTRLILEFNLYPAFRYPFVILKSELSR